MKKECGTGRLQAGSRTKVESLAENLRRTT